MIQAPLGLLTGQQRQMGSKRHMQSVLTATLSASIAADHRGPPTSPAAEELRGALPAGI